MEMELTLFSEQTRQTQQKKPEVQANAKRMFAEQANGK